MIRFNVLGPVDLRAADGSTIQSVLVQPKRIALLAFLATASPRSFHRRDSLLPLFWPEFDQDRARAALRRALHHLRAGLGDGVLLNRGNEEIGLDEANFRCDVGEFVAAIGQARIADAIAIYRGNFLEGFSVPDASPDFDRWVDAERSNLRASALQACMLLTDASASDGDLDSARRSATRSLEIAPDDERAVRRFISVLDRIGDRAGALRAYEEFAGRLARDYELEPSTETRYLVEAIRTRPSMPPGPTRASPITTAAVPRPAAGSDVEPEIRSSPSPVASAGSAAPPRASDSEALEAVSPGSPAGSYQHRTLRVLWPSGRRFLSSPVASALTAVLLLGCAGLVYSRRSAHPNPVAPLVDDEPDLLPKAVFYYQDRLDDGSPTRIIGDGRAANGYPDGKSQYQHGICGVQAHVFADTAAGQSGDVTNDIDWHWAELAPAERAACGNGESSPLGRFITIDFDGALVTGAARARVSGGFFVNVRQVVQLAFNESGERRFRLMLNGVPGCDFLRYADESFVVGSDTVRGRPITVTRVGRLAESGFDMWIARSEPDAQGRHVAACETGRVNNPAYTGVYDIPFSIVVMSNGRP